MGSSTLSSSFLLLTFSLFIILGCSFIKPNHAVVLKSTEFTNQIIAGHNTARAVVGVPPLEWSRDLAIYSKAYLDYNRQNKGCTLENSGPLTLGENIYMGPSGTTAVDAVASWVSEKQWYNYGNNTCAIGHSCLHYTQVVWRTTIRVGCAQIICSNGNVFIACEYYPHGNYQGAKPY